MLSGRIVREGAASASDPELAAVLRHVQRRRAAHASGRHPLAVPDRPQPRGPERPDGSGERRGPGGRILAVERVGPSIRILRVAKPAGLRFRPGQYLRLGLDGRKARKFSIASAPHDPELLFCIGLNPQGRLTPAVFRLAAGDHLELADRPGGSFALDAGAERHLMVATTTGIAPLRSMLRDARHRGHRGSFVIVHGGSHPDDLPFREELAALAAEDPAVRYLPTVSRPGTSRSQGWSGPTGRVEAHAPALAEAFGTAGTRVYLCGNDAMVRGLGERFRRGGFAVSTESYG